MIMTSTWGNYQVLRNFTFFTSFITIKKRLSNFFKTAIIPELKRSSWTCIQPFNTQQIQIQSASINRGKVVWRGERGERVKLTHESHVHP